MTDTAKWDDEWFMNLSGPTKLLWYYLTDQCDHAGVWKVNQRLAVFKIGLDINWSESLAELGDRIAVLPCGDRWFIRKFVEFQYGSMPNASNRAHLGVLKVLNQFSLPWSSQAPSKPLGSPLLGAKEKEREKDKDSRGSAEGDADPAPNPIIPKAEAHEDDSRRQFRALLLRLLVADGPEAIRRWWSLSGQGDSRRSLPHRIEMITWLVAEARRRGVVVQFASHVLPMIGEWPGPRVKADSALT